MFRASFFCAPMGAHLRVQVPLRAGHSEQSETQLHEGVFALDGRFTRCFNAKTG